MNGLWQARKMNGQNYNLLEKGGKRFSRKDAPWQRRKKLMGLLWATIVGIIMGGLILAIAWWMNRKR